jgi:hypothetical protein
LVVEDDAVDVSHERFFLVRLYRAAGSLDGGDAGDERTDLGIPQQRLGFERGP